MGKSCFWNFGPLFYCYRLTVMFGPLSGHLHTRFCYKSAIFIITFSFKNSFFSYVFFLCTQDVLDFCYFR